MSKKREIVKAYSYARWSSARQSEGHSLERQLSAAKAYAEEHGLILDRDMVDDAVSAYRGDNRISGELGRFRARIEAGEIAQGSYLLIDSYDRFSREAATVSVQALLEIINAGVIVVTLSNKARFQRGADDATQHLMYAVMDLDRAHKESVEKGRKVKSAHDASKALARNDGRPWTPVAPSWLDVTSRGSGRNRKIEFRPIPERVDLIQRIFSLYEQGVSTTAIARMLNDQNIATPQKFTAQRTPKRLNGEARKSSSKGKWSSDAIYAILTNRALLGEYQPHSLERGAPHGRRVDGPPISNYYGESIVDPARFELVQISIRGRRSPSRRISTKAVRNLFSGLGKCASCQGTFSLHSGTNYDNHRQIPRLRCVAAQNGGGCDNRRRFRYPDFELAVLKGVSEINLPDMPNNFEYLLTEIERLKLNLDDLDRRVDAAMIKSAEDPEDDRRERYYQTLRSEYSVASSLLNEKQMGYSEKISGKSPVQVQEDIAEAMRQMDIKTGDELYAVRSKLALSISKVIEWIEFDQNGSAIIVLKGGGDDVYMYFEGYGFVKFNTETGHTELR